MTLLLAIAVFLTKAADYLPKTSFPTISVLSIKLLVDMIISSIVLFFTIVGLRFYYADEKCPVQGWIVVITKNFLCTLRCKRWKTEKYILRNINHGTEGKSPGCKNNTDNEINKQPLYINNTDIETSNPGQQTDGLRVYQGGVLPRSVIDEDENDQGNVENAAVELWLAVGPQSL